MYMYSSIISSLVSSCSSLMKNTLLTIQNKTKKKKKKKEKPVTYCPYMHRISSTIVKTSFTFMNICCEYGWCRREWNS